MAVNEGMFKDNDRRRWPLLLFLLVALGISCPALLITTPWQHTEAQSRFVPVSLHSQVNADYTQNPNPPFFPAVRMDLIWDAILDRDPTAKLIDRQERLLASLDEAIPASSSICEGQYLVPAAIDTWVDSENPTMIAGNDTILQLGRSGDEVKRVLLYFPVDDYLQQGTYIYRARLELHLTDPASPRPREVHFFNLKQPFAEATTNWLNQPDPYIDALPPTMPGRNIHTWDVTNSVRSWLLGHYANNGLMLELLPEVAMDLRYYSREADTRLNFAVGDDALAPRLVIDCGPEQEIAEAPSPAEPVPGSPTDPENIPPAEVPPPLPVVTPTATPVTTPTPLPTLTPTPGGIIPLPTLTPTFTPVPPTETPVTTETPTTTPVPTPTPIPPTSRPPTSTPVPTATPVPTPIPNQADVAITKSDSPDPVTSGGVLSYNLNVTNNGPDPATNVTVTDSLPGGVTLLNVSSGQGTCTGTTCNLGTLANGSTVWVNIQVTVNAVSGTLGNTANVSASEADPNGANNSAATTTTISAPPSADLSITKTDSPDPVTSGSTLTYNLTVTNNGPNDATNVTVVDTLPANVTVSGLPGGCSGTTVITCNLGPLASGNNRPISIQVTVNATSGTLNNTASVSADQADPNTANNSASASTTVSVPTADVSITKSDSPDPVDPGGVLTYTLNIVNNGPDTATNVTVVDTLPSGVTLSSAPGCSGSTTITCNLGTITSGANATVDIVVNVNAGASGTLNNTASVSASETDPNTANNTATALTTVNAPAPVADLVLSKSDAPDPVTPGSNLIYTLDVVNSGPDTATGVTLVDTLPAGVTLVSATSTQGTCSGTTTITCNMGDIASGGSETVTIEVTVGVGTTGTLNNSASVSANEADPNTANNVATAATTVNTNADLSITKSDNPDPVLPADNLTYTLNVTNNGPANATGVTVVDTLPVSVTLVSATWPAGTCTGITTLTCNLGNLANGASETITIVVTVGAGATGPLNNSATVSGSQPDPNAANNTASASTAVNVQADLSITKSDSPDPVLTGDNLIYTVNVTNNGPANATGVSMVDTLPSGVTLVSANASQGSGCVGTSCDLGDLASGASATVTIEVTVDATSGTLSNTASVSGNEPDSNMANNSVTENTTITPSVDLSITKDGTPTTVVPGNNITYPIIVTNNGPSDATGVVVTDTLPSGVTLVGTSISCSGTTTLVCDLGNIAGGANVPFTIVVSVDAATPPGSLLNSATVAGNEYDPNTGNNTDTATVTVTTDADLSITKTDSPDPIMVNNDLTYTLVITNNGPANATGVVVTDTLPSAGINNIVPDAGCSEAGGVVTCTIGSLAAGSSVQRTITVRVNASASGSLTNQAEVSGDQPDPNTGNNTASTTTTVATSSDADLVVTKTVDNAGPTEGDTIVYEIIVANNGPIDPAANVRVDDLLPGGVTYVDHSGVGSYDSATGAWILGTPLSIGSPETLLITATVDAGTGGMMIDNVAEGSSAQPDPNLSNNIYTATITVASPLVDLALSGLVDDSTPLENYTVVYAIGVTNNGPDNATNVVIQNVLPGGITYVDSSPTQGSYVPGTGLWAVGNLNNSASASLMISATVDAGTAGSTIINTASVDSVDQTDTNSGNDGATVPITVTASICGSPDVDLTATADSYLTSGQPNDNHGTELVLVTKPNGNIQHTLIQFDISSISAGTPINCAELQINQQNGDGLTAHVHRVDAPWVETEVTWDERVSGQSWGTPGGDFIFPEETTFSLDTTGIRSIDITALVQYWVDNPGSNYGLIITSSSNGADIFFDSREGATQPLLIVDY